MLMVLASQAGASGLPKPVGAPMMLGSGSSAVGNSWPAASECLVVGPLMRAEGAAPARAQQGLVQDVRPVGAAQDDDPCLGAETVHLHQQLVERVLPLIVAASEAAPASGAPNGIYLICTSSAAEQQLCWTCNCVSGM